MTTKTILAVTVLCASAFQPSAKANDITIHHLMTELMQQQAVELQQQLKKNTSHWIQQMAQQAAASMPQAAKTIAESDNETDTELAVAKQQHDELGE